jgi:negative regulator of sigma E activity
MSEQEQSSSQLSALFDGELPTQQAEMVIRRALKDPSMRRSWERYALIGACLREEPVRLTGSVADRIQAALAGERELNVSALPARGRAMTTRGAPRITMFGRGALGGAIAAGVAVISIFVVRNVAPTPGSAGDIVAQNPALSAQPVRATDGAPGSYTTPGENSPAQLRPIDASLGYYLVAHSEEAASALRFSYDLAEGGAVMTEDEIRALR